MQIFYNLPFILMGNLEDWNVEAQIAIFFNEIIVFSFLFWLAIISPVPNYYNFSTELLSVLGFRLERAPASLQEQEVIFLI